MCSTDKKFTIQLIIYYVPYIGDKTLYGIREKIENYDDSAKS